MKHLGIGCVVCLVSVLLPALAFAASPPTFDLPELAIDAERAFLAEVLPFSHESIPTATLELRYAPTPNDHLKMNPSITLPGSMKGMGGAPSIRGLPNYTNQVLLDGTPITMPWANWANLTTFPLRRLQRVNIVKGGPSLIYGSSGLGGAINLVLPEARDLPGLRLVEEIGNQSTRHREVLYGREAHQNHHLFGYFSDETVGWYPNADRETQALLYRGSVITDRGWKFKLGIFDLTGHTGLPNIGDPTMTPQRWDRWNMTHGDLIIEKDFGSDRHLTVRGYRNAESSHNVDYADFTYSRPVGEGTMDMSTQGQELIYNFRLGRRHRLGVGWQRRRDWQAGASVGNVERELITNGLFLSDFIDCSSRLGVHLAARTDDHSVAGRENSWSGELTWKASDRSTLNVGTSRLARFPVMRELYMTFIGSKNKAGNFVAAVPGQGDTNNQAEIARTWEATFRHRFDDRWQASLGRFRTRVTDLIDRVFNPGWPKTSPRFWWRNLATVEFEGWESRVEGRLSRNLHLWTGYTRQEEADNQTTGIRLDERPTYKWTGGLTWTRGRTRTLLTWERRGKAPYLATGGGKTQPDEVGASTRVDLTIRRQLSESAALYVSVDNLFDADIEALGHVLGAPPILETPRRGIVGLEAVF